MDMIVIKVKMGSVTEGSSTLYIPGLTGKTGKEWVSD